MNDNNQSLPLRLGPAQIDATMRLSESRIKAAILDTDPEIRQRATKFFAKSFSSDTSVMRLVIKAVETFGREDAYHLICLSRDLPQTADTIDWIIDELNNERSDQHENYIYNLSIVLVKADAAFLLLKESAILESRHFLGELHAPFSKRLQMLSWDEATCWHELEAFCEEGKDKQYVNEVDLGYANRITEALARYGDDCEEKVQALLRQKVKDLDHDPMMWVEPLVVRLAGEAHLDSRKRTGINPLAFAMDRKMPVLYRLIDYRSKRGHPHGGDWRWGLASGPESVTGTNTSTTRKRVSPGARKDPLACASCLYYPWLSPSRRCPAGLCDMVLVPWMKASGSRSRLKPADDEFRPATQTTD